MSNDWRNELMQRYPQLFDQSGYPTVGDGWRDLLERALKRIAAAIAHDGANAGVRISQIKEKYGDLRLYFDSRNLSKNALAKVDEAVELAEARSACTCEQCGAEGRLYVRGDWYSTRCPDHADGKLLPFKPGWENLRVAQTFERGKRRVVSCRRYDRERDVFVDVPPPRDLNDET